ncbi:uncharacterized protein LOC131070450 isoform X2 [Cryptomeria japonica]|uniref:uncharacterized protein LOC131070450 isoform X2 n=1 Tax=Cryptomeria japonica TaxID=3369 RepID=UPI0027DA234D|nr:uncharacterized protein LOC131070450 isoform X2 [Cryptomeria japonica]
MGKKQKKPGVGKQKTERKTAKAEEKRARRGDKHVSQEDDIDSILASIRKEEAKKKEVHVEENVPPPSPRCNCSVTVNPLKDTELIIYGGEYYNGDKTFVYGDLFRYNTEKKEWKLISSPNGPPPRSAHQAVAWKNSLFIFGGEFTSPNQERFHHYKDFWCLDLNTNQWEQLQLKGSPSARSGHRMVLYKHKIVIFGGFYDTLREVRYYNDLHIFDLDEFKWQEVKPKPGSLWPSPRSGFQLVVYQDEIFLYGGYFKDHAPDKDVSEKGIVLVDMWVLDPRAGEWNKVKKLGMPPGARAGFSMCVHKKRALLFGGVVDMEVKGDVLRSLFLNELYGFQLDNHRWYPLELRKGKLVKDKTGGRVKPEQQSGGAVTKSKDGEDVLCESKATNASEALSSMDVLHKNSFEMTELDEDDCHQLSDQVTNKLSVDDLADITNYTSNGKDEKKNANGEAWISITTEAVKPCGRINACMAVGKDTLYLYGGMMEVGDQEVTLDDVYILDLNKLDEWKCIKEASKTEWIEASDDEDENDEDDEDNDATDSDSEEEEDDNEEEKKESDKNNLGVEAAAAIIRGEGRKLRRKERRAKIDQIRAELGLSDSQRTPLPGESLKDFFSRTNMYWQMAAYEHTQHTGKRLGSRN